MQEVKRCIALDVGDKTIGIAISDLLGLTAQGLETIQRKSNKEDLKRLGELISTYNVTTFVIKKRRNTLYACIGDESRNKVSV